MQIDIAHRRNGSRVRILALVTDAHGGFGGISQYNRDALEAMCSYDTVTEVDVVARHASLPLAELHKKLRYDFKGLRGKRQFAIAAIRRALVVGRIDLIFCGHLNFMPLAAMIARAWNAPVVLSLHGIDAWTPPRVMPTKRVVRSAARVLCVSEVTSERFQSWSGFDRSRISIVPNTFRPELLCDRPRNEQLAARLGLAGKTVLLTLGRMASEERAKGFDEIVDILPELAVDVPNIVYIAAGDGSDRRRLENKVAALGLVDRVIFPGRVSDQEKADLFRLADAFVMPSHGEGFGIVMLEALAAGVPVMGSTLDGTREALLHGELGILVDPNDPLAIRRGILEALGRPRHVPQGLEYFCHERFRDRLRSALSTVCPV